MSYPITSNDADHVVDVKDLERYFEVIGGATEIYTGSFLTADGVGPQSGFGVVHGTAKELIARAIELYAESKATLHVCLNRTNLRGRKIKDIEACRVLCVDIDDGTDREVIRSYVNAYAPLMVVESSPGKFHLYWSVSATIPLPQWSKIQLALAHGLGGDKNLSQINKTIRVPGVPRVTKDGTTYVPRIVYISDYIEELSDINSVRSSFPEFDQWLAVAEKEQTKREKSLKSAIAKGNYRRLAQLAGNGTGRNTTLYAAVNERVGAEGLSHEQALAFGDTINKQFATALDNAELVKTVESAWQHGIDRYEARENRIAAEQNQLLETLGTPISQGVMSSVNGTNGHPSVQPITQASPSFSYDYTDTFLEQNRFTDKSVVARVIQRFQHLMVKVDKEFYAFSEKDKVWRPQNSGDHTEMYRFYEQAINDTVKDPQFIRTCCTNERGEFSASLKKRAEDRFWSNRLHYSTVDAVKNSEQIRRSTAEIFDAVTNLILLQNGVLDMRTRTLRAPTASDYLLKQSFLTYDETAKCPWWLNFLSEVFAENNDPEAMVSFMQELFGYSLSGEISEQKLFCHYGDGSNGKSKVLKALALIGGGYATGIDSDDLARPKNGFGKALERIGAKIEGHRIAVIDDISTQTVWNEAFVKNLTSDSMRARGEYEKSRLAANRAKMHLGLNKAPIPESENYGLLRRLCIIPYVRQFEPDGKISRYIDHQTRKEAQGILNWAIEGYQRYAARGSLVYSHELSMAVQAYKDEHFSLETVLDALFERDLDPAPKLEFFSDLLNDVNNRLRDEGSGQQVTKDELVHAIKRKFKLTPQKKWDGKRNNAFTAYALKLKHERKTDTSIL